MTEQESEQKVDEKEKSDREEISKESKYGKIWLF